VTCSGELASVKRLRRVYERIVEVPKDHYNDTIVIEEAEIVDNMTALGDDLLSTVNKLQDLVFNTIGNDSLDLPQIVGSRYRIRP